MPERSCLHLNRNCAARRKRGPTDPVEKNCPQCGLPTFPRPDCLLYWLGLLIRYENPMRFFYLLSPATWLKIALGSLFLGGFSLWFLSGYRISITRVAATPAAPRASIASPASAASSEPAVPAVIANTDALTNSASSPATTPGTMQTHAIAPEGILDQYAEFAEVVEFDDTPIKPDYILPKAVAPTGLLDPNWSGNPP
jgi:hypothetical protein